jgi:hypothetical protein
VSSQLPEKKEMASSSPSVVIPSSFAIPNPSHVDKSSTTPAIFTQTSSLTPTPLPTPPLVPSSVTPTGTQQSQSQPQPQSHSNPTTPRQQTRPPRFTLSRGSSVSSSSFYGSMNSDSGDDEAVRSLRKDILELEEMIASEAKDIMGSSSSSYASGISANGKQTPQSQHLLMQRSDSMDPVSMQNLLNGIDLFADDKLLDDAQAIITDLQKVNAHLHTEIDEMKSKLADTNSHNTTHSNGKSEKHHHDEDSIDTQTTTVATTADKQIFDLQRQLEAANERYAELERLYQTESLRRLAAEKERDAYADAYETSMKHFEYWNKKKQQRSSPRK